MHCNKTWGICDFHADKHYCMFQDNQMLHGLNCQCACGDECTPGTKYSWGLGGCADYLVDEVN